MYFAEFSHLINALTPLDGVASILCLSELIRKNPEFVNAPMNEHGDLLLDYLFLCKFPAEVLRFWIGHEKVHLNKVSPNGTTPLIRAIADDDLHRVSSLLHSAALPNVGRAMNGTLTPLHLAVQKKNTFIIQLLLDNFANTNIATIHGTPLAMAIRNRFFPAVKMLLAAGADLGDESDPNSPISEAAKADSLIINNIILEHRNNPVRVPTSPMYVTMHVTSPCIAAMDDYCSPSSPTQNCTPDISPSSPSNNTLHSPSYDSYAPVSPAKRYSPSSPTSSPSSPKRNKI